MYHFSERLELVRKVPKCIILSECIILTECIILVKTLCNSRLRRTVGFNSIHLLIWTKNCMNLSGSCVTENVNSPEKSRRFQNYLFGRGILDEHSNGPIFLFGMIRPLNMIFTVWSSLSSPQNCIKHMKRTSLNSISWNLAKQYYTAWHPLRIAPRAT